MQKDNKKTTHAPVRVIPISTTNPKPSRGLSPEEAKQRGAHACAPAQNPPLEHVERKAPPFAGAPERRFRPEVCCCGRPWTLLRELLGRWSLNVS